MNEEALAYWGLSGQKQLHTMSKHKQKFRLIPNNHQALSLKELSKKLVADKTVLSSFEV